MPQIIEYMKALIVLALLSFAPAFASVVGISTHPLNDEARVISAELMGYMSQRHEMSTGLRYTQEVSRGQLMDFAIAGGTEARALNISTGYDYQIFSEDVNQPRVSIKPFFQYQKFNNDTYNLMGAAPTLRKSFSIEGLEFFPFLALPTGLKLDSANDGYRFSTSLSMGASMPFPRANNDKLLLTVEANRNLGAASDYVGCLVSWVWK